jgi:hypothetical protein
MGAESGRSEARPARPIQTKRWVASIAKTKLKRVVGSVMSTKEIKEASCTTRDPLAKKREIFTKVFLPKHPPVLGEWFKRTFPDAQVRNSSEIWRIE